MPEIRGQLIFAQIDHLGGEQLGTLIEVLFKEGVKNAHLVPSLTKKGRPGYLLFIDLGEETPERISELFEDYNLILTKEKDDALIERRFIFKFSS